MNIVLVTGAYKNAGDHLIGFRARALLSEVSAGSATLTTLDRKQITDQSYDVMNSADFVLLTGGPALRWNTFPGIYPIDLSRIHVPVRLFGVGTNSALSSDAQKLQFTPETKSALVAMHQDTELVSSVREDNSLQLLSSVSIDNVLMTGCPAWYDLVKLDESLFPLDEVRHIVVSSPAKPQRNLLQVVRQIGRRFPAARKTLTFQAGFGVPAPKRFSIRDYSLHLRKIAARAGFDECSLESSDELMREVISTADLHVGYRVHQHILALSQRRRSILISEDNRGISQSLTLGTGILTREDSAQTIMQRVEAEIKGDDVSSAVGISTMQRTWPTMQKYLRQFISPE